MSITTTKTIGSWMHSPWTCEQCQAEFPIGALLAHHLSQCKGLSSCSYMSHSQLNLGCPICYRHSKKRASLEEGNEEKKVKEKEKVFRSIESLDNHVENCPHRGTEPNISPFICEYCNKMFVSLLNLVQHILVYHEVYRPIQSICNASVKRHSFRCQACSQFFGSSAKLALHVSKSSDCQGCVQLSNPFLDNEVSSFHKQVPVYRAVTLVAQNVSLQGEFLRKFPSSRVGMEYVTYDFPTIETSKPPFGVVIPGDKTGQSSKYPNIKSFTKDRKFTPRFGQRDFKKTRKPSPSKATEDVGIDKARLSILASIPEEVLIAELRKRKASQSAMNMAALLSGSHRSVLGKKRRLEFDELEEMSMSMSTSGMEALIAPPKSRTVDNSIKTEKVDIDFFPHTSADTASVISLGFQKKSYEVIEVPGYQMQTQADETSFRVENEKGDLEAASQGLDEILGSIHVAPLPSAVLSSSPPVNVNGTNEIVRESMRDRIKRIRTMKKQNLMNAMAILPQPQPIHSEPVKSSVVSVPIKTPVIPTVTSTPTTGFTMNAVTPQRPISVGSARKRTSNPPPKSTPPPPPPPPPPPKPTPPPPPAKVQMTARKSGSCPVKPEQMKQDIPKEEVELEPPAPRVLTCPACGVQFTSLLQRDLHLKQAHQGLKVFGCQICGHGFDTYQSFRTHCAKRHSNQIDIAMYGENGLSNGNDAADEIAEEDDMEYICELCSLAFFSEPVLQLHMEHDHPSFKAPVANVAPIDANVSSSIIKSEVKGDVSESSNGKAEQPMEIIDASCSGEDMQTPSIRQSNATIPMVKRPLTTATLSGDDFCFLSKKSILLTPGPLDSPLQQRQSSSRDSSVIPTQPVKPTGLSRWEKLWLAYYDLKPEDLWSVGQGFPNAYQSPLCCRKCGEEMYNELEGLIHWKREHPTHENGESSASGNMLACQFCFQLFLGPQALADIKMHLKSVHDKSSKGYVCEECNRSYSRQKLLEWHLESHKKDANQQSREPQVSPGALIHPTLYVCPQCSKLFGGQEAYERLQTHMSVDCREQE